MTTPSPRPANAGGFLIACGAILGTCVGVAVQQVSAGFVIGLALGVLVAIAVWLVDKRRP